MDHADRRRMLAAAFNNAMKWTPPQDAHGFALADVALRAIEVLERIATALEARPAVAEVTKRLLARKTTGG